MLYDDFALSIQKEYELFLFALTGRYLSLVAPGLEVSPATVLTMRKGGAELQYTFMQTAIRITLEYAHAIGMDVTSDRIDEFVQLLGGYAAQNVNGLADRMRGQKVNESDLMDNMHGAMGMLLQRKLSKPEFRVQTESGRSFDAVALVRATARDFAYQGWIRSELERISLTADIAWVVYPDPKHADHGMAFSISGNTLGMPSFAQIGARIFHFNSSARVSDHVPS